jgi:hypothetical protein
VVRKEFPNGSIIGFCGKSKFMIASLALSQSVTTWSLFIISTLDMFIGVGRGIHRRSLDSFHSFVYSSVPASTQRLNGPVNAVPAIICKPWYITNGSCIFASNRGDSPTNRTVDIGTPIAGVFAGTQ